MHGAGKVSYRHPLLEPILSETYGIPIYQEQVMLAAMQLAGYTASEADELRKAISKKNADVLAKHREKFVQGAETKGIPQGNCRMRSSPIGKTSPTTASTRAMPLITA